MGIKKKRIAGGGKNSYVAKLVFAAIKDNVNTV